jgi:hypothetical protein
MKVIGLEDATQIKPVVKDSPLYYYFLNTPGYNGMDWIVSDDMGCW